MRSLTPNSRKKRFSCFWGHHTHPEKSILSMFVPRRFRGRVDLPKKIPLVIRLKTTRPSHGRFWPRPLPREAKQSFHCRGFINGLFRCGSKMTAAFLWALWFAGPSSSISDLRRRSARRARTEARGSCELRARINHVTHPPQRRADETPRPAAEPPCQFFRRHRRCLGPRPVPRTDTTGAAAARLGPPWPRSARAVGERSKREGLRVVGVVAVVLEERR